MPIFPPMLPSAFWYHCHLPLSRVIKVPHQLWNAGSDLKLPISNQVIISGMLTLLTSVAMGTAVLPAVY